MRSLAPRCRAQLAIIRSGRTAKDHLSDGSHDRCSDRCRCLKEKPANRYIDHRTLEGEQPCMITAAAEQVANRA
jgi:hypothetical protein